MLEPRDKLIVRQVAFKGAIECLPEHIVWTINSGETQPDAKQLIQAVKYLTDQFEQIIIPKDA